MPQPSTVMSWKTISPEQDYSAQGIFMLTKYLKCLNVGKLGKIEIVLVRIFILISQELGGLH